MSIPRIAAYPMPEQLPASRVDWTADPARSALLVHDMQDYFLDFYDRARPPVPELLANTRRLIDAARAAGVPVIYTAQPARQSDAERGLLGALWGAGLTARPPEAATICAALAPAPGDLVLAKWRYSAFQRTELEDRLRALGRDQLAVCGVYAHIGCLMSACEAFMKDIQPFVVADALADFTPADHRMALDYVAGCCGRVLRTAELLTAWPAATAAPSAGLPVSLDALIDELSRSLRLAPGELGADDRLLDWGLDSIRVMAFVEAWRGAGRDVRFVQLAEADTPAAWWALLQAAPALRR